MNSGYDVTITFINTGTEKPFQPPATSETGNDYIVVSDDGMLLFQRFVALNGDHEMVYIKKYIGNGNILAVSVTLVKNSSRFDNYTYQEAKVIGFNTINNQYNNVVTYGITKPNTPVFNFPDTRKYRQTMIIKNATKLVINARNRDLANDDIWWYYVKSEDDNSIFGYIFVQDVELIP